MAESKKGQGDTTGGGKKASGASAAGKGTGKQAAGSTTKEDKPRASRGKRVAAAAAVAVAGGAAVVAVKRARRRRAAAAAEAEAGKGKAKRKRAGSRKSGEGTGQPRAARGGLAQQVRPDAALAAVVGSEAGTRAEITKRVWAYIKSNDLQDAQNRREIRADAKLRPVFGAERITMFELPGLINQHVSIV
ncbi:MAG TPA: SWIB/MDM2 domain-containing protein [Longimicrobium sp.]|nr:SWIB/MDM2 domain-containing protein [Longimicrobium sp.]